MAQVSQYAVGSPEWFRARRTGAVSPSSVARAMAQRAAAQSKPAASTATKAAATPATPARSSNGNGINNQVFSFTDASGRTFSVNPASDGGYLSAYGQYVNDAANSKALYEQQYATNTSNLAKTLEQNNATTNSNYDNSARQAYVDYMRRQRALPSQLQALGVNGGATESGLLNLYNNYGASHASNEQQRNAELATNQQSYDDALADLVSERTQYLMDYEKDLAAQKQQAINNQINEYNNEVTRFSSSVAQYPTTEEGYKSYEKWIANMQASSDPLKDIKIALIRQQMASQFPEGLAGIGKNSGSGGGGGGYGGRSYGGGGGSSSGGSGGSNDTYTADERTAKKSNSNSVAAYSTGNGGNNKKKKKNSVSKKGDTYTTNTSSSKSRKKGSISGTKKKKTSVKSAIKKVLKTTKKTSSKLRKSR